ncbi:MAG: sensor histidine kinase [Blastocatellia bacterium]
MSANHLNPRGRKWLLIAAVWMGLSFFFASQGYAQYVAMGRPLAFWRILGWQLVSGGLWLALTPLILWLGARFRFERGVWKQSLPVHLAASALIACFQQGLDALILPRMGYPPGSSIASDSLMAWLTAWRVFLLVNLHLSISIYWAVLGVQYAIGYYRKYRERELRETQLEARLAESRLQILRMQLHPHFLFNTLNTISELVYRDPEAAEQMIANLSDLLRMSLDVGGRQEVPLHQELDFLRKYLEIEQARFQDRLRLRWQVDPRLLGASVPHLILQPLVENAIRHGIAPLAGGGTVEISAARENGSLRMRVRDNGRGLPEGLISEGVGLSNTRARLAQLYGAAQQFELTREDGGGMSVHLRIPFHETFYAGRQGGGGDHDDSGDTTNG